MQPGRGPLSADGSQYHPARAQLPALCRTAARRMAVSDHQFIVNYLDLLRLALPQAILVITALFVVAIDRLALRRSSVSARFTAAAVVGSLGCVAAIARLALGPVQMSLPGNALFANPVTQFAQISILALTIAILLLAADSTFTAHVAEYVLLVLLATVG